MVVIALAALAIGSGGGVAAVLAAAAGGTMTAGEVAAASMAVAGGAVAAGEVASGIAIGAGVLSAGASIAESSGNEVNQSGRQWNKGNKKTSEESLRKHFEKHGDDVGAKDIQQYYNKANEFANKLKGARVKDNVDGFTEGVKRYYKNGKYIDLAPDGSIISFGVQ